MRSPPVHGLTAGPGSIAHWPGGLVIAFPAAGHGQRHAGDGAGRPQPDVQPDPRVGHRADDRRRPHRRGCRRWRRRPVVPLLPRCLRRSGELRHESRRLGHEHGGPLGGRRALRPARDLGHRGRGRSPATSSTRRGPTRSPGGSRPVISTCPCGTARWHSSRATFVASSSSVASSSPSCARRVRA